MNRRGSKRLSNAPSPPTPKAGNPMPRNRETKARDSVVSTVVTVTVAPPNSNSYGVTGYIKAYDDTGIEIVSTPGHPLKMATTKDGATSQEQLPVSSMFIPTSTIEIVTH